MSVAEPKHRLLLQWLVLVSTLVVALIFAGSKGALTFVFKTDQTWITVAIALIFFLTLIHGAQRVWRISCTLNSLVHQSKHDEFLTMFFRDYQTRSPAQWDEILNDRYRNPQEIGWYLSGLLMKLGLVGTVVGFMLMMVSVGTIENLDVSYAQDLIQRMTSGMGVALVTTLAGLLTSMVSSLQYLMIDHGANRIIALAYLQADKSDQGAKS